MLRGMKMKNKNWSTLTAIAAFMIGVILLWSFGRNWLNFESPLVVLGGLIGVALPVLIFAIWKLSHRSPDDK
jgi:SNF family Na+-dependent transporter